MIAIALKAGFDLSRTQRLFDKFRYHHQAKGSRYADWTAAWSMWIHNEVDFDERARAKEAPVSNFL
jgi:hypothetical protein